MLKHLLGSYGFELVMQFNELHSHRRAAAAAAAGNAAGDSNGAGDAQLAAGSEEEENKENDVGMDPSDTEKEKVRIKCSPIL